ncbi:MAG: hypothetical protein ACYSSP_04240 [Planctomycetota bacterium]|jgi:hypothetical protein
MSQLDTGDESRLDEGTEQFESGRAKLVPVSEAIHYRRRAQSAEQKAESLGAELEKVKAEATEASKQLDMIRFEQTLKDKLTAAGSIDLEAALLITKARLEVEAGADLDSIIEQLKKEKSHLFVDSGEMGHLSKTAGVKERASSGEVILERAAKKAATTGTRRDLQEYLQLRRNFV